jgi:hypothetical protein
MRLPTCKAAPLILAIFAANAALALQTTASGTTGTGGSGGGTNPNDPGGTGAHYGTGTTSTTTTTTTTTKKHAAAHKSFKGTVASVDSAVSTFTVHPAKGADMTLKVYDKTKYLPKGKTWSDVVQGAEVSGTYHNDGSDNWALTVHFRAAPVADAASKTGSR